MNLIGFASRERKRLEGEFMGQKNPSINHFPKYMWVFDFETGLSFVLSIELSAQILGFCIKMNEMEATVPPYVSSSITSTI